MFLCTSTDVSFKVMYVGCRQSFSVLKPGHVYNVTSTKENDFHKTYILKEFNGEFDQSNFVRFVKYSIPLNLVLKSIPKVGERFVALDGNQKTVTSSNIIYVCPQSLKDKIFHIVRVLTNHSLLKGGCARLYTLYY